MPASICNKAPPVPSAPDLAGPLVIQTLQKSSSTLSGTRPWSAHRADAPYGAMVVKAKSAAAMKRQETLNLKRLRYEQQQQAKLDLWCEEHDEDGNGEFDRKELEGLLNALYPEHILGEDMLDQLMERATGVYTSSLTLRGDKNGRVTKKALFKTVSQYECCEPPSAPRRTHALVAHTSSY